MTALLWCEAKDDWMSGHGFMEWHCRCGEPVSLLWTCNHDLYDTDEPITPESPITSSWRVECNNGHVLMLSHELGDESADTAEPPTTELIAKALASAEDVAAWRAYEAPKPPWNKTEVAS